MSYLPRTDILDRLDLMYNIRLISADVIHDVDLQAIWGVLEDLQETISTLEDERDDMICDAATLEEETDEKGDA